MVELLHTYELEFKDFYLDPDIASRRWLLTRLHIIGAHSLPVEQGRIEMPKVPRHLRRCTFCATNAIGDERHCVFDCPHFQGLRQQHAMIFKESHDAMRSVMWHKDQKSVCALSALVLAIVNEAQTL